MVKLYKAGIQQTLDILFLRGGVEFVTSSDCVSRDSADRTLIAWDFQTTAKLSNQIYHVRNSSPKPLEFPRKVSSPSIIVNFYSTSLKMLNVKNDRYSTLWNQHILTVT